MPRTTAKRGEACVEKGAVGDPPNVADTYNKERAYTRTRVLCLLSPFRGLGGLLVH